jgi:methionyl-tRNA formyltransferase
VTRAVVFAYSEVGVRCLQVLLDAGVEIPLVFTHADDPGEGRWFGSVRELALRQSGQRRIEVVMPEDPNTPEWIERGRAARPDFLFSFYYRHMLTAPWLVVPARGALNMHGSLLPKYRGRAPVHWAILNGETETGASLHYMLEKPDAGALVDQMAVAILENDDALAVSRKLADAAAQVLRRALPRLIAGTAQARPLDLATGSYFGRRRPEDGRIDWRQGARQVHDLVRAVAPPFPGAFTDLNGCRLMVLETRVDGDARHPARAPCLYAEGGAWYADCTDGRRLRLTRLDWDGKAVAPDAVPAFLSQQPVSLSGT